MRSCEAVSPLLRLRDAEVPRHRRDVPLRPFDGVEAPRRRAEGHVDAALQLLHKGTDAVTERRREIRCPHRSSAASPGWIQARIPETRTGLSVAVIGSGPAGLACADVLNQQGHKVTVHEREDRPGGLLMYGIPNMKLDKGKVERRINLLEEEGIEFVCNAEIGKNVNVETIRNE